MEWQTLVESLKSSFISSPVEFDSIHFKRVVLAMFNTSFRRSQYRLRSFKTLKHLKFDTTGFCSNLLPSGRFATRTLEDGCLEHLYTYTPTVMVVVRSFEDRVVSATCNGAKIYSGDYSCAQLLALLTSSKPCSKRLTAGCYQLLSAFSKSKSCEVCIKEDSRRVLKDKTNNMPGLQTFYSCYHQS